MADTTKGYWPEESCSDCGEKGVVIFKHWGSLVPEGEIGNLCLFVRMKGTKIAKKAKHPCLLGGSHLLSIVLFLKK